MKSSKDEVNPHDDVPLTEFEKRVFRTIIFGSLAICVICGFLGFIFVSSAWMTGAMFAFMLACIFGMFWFFQECITSLRDYGLGEGMANLYGEDRAKFHFGEHYMRPDRKDD